MKREQQAAQGLLPPGQQAWTWDPNQTSKPNAKQRKSSTKKWWEEAAVAGGQPQGAVWGPAAVSPQAPQQQNAWTPPVAEDLTWLKSQVKDLCFDHQTHFNCRVCHAFITGNCKRRHDLAANHKAYSLIPVPQSVQQEWKKYNDECKAWGAKATSPIIAANEKGRS